MLYSYQGKKPSVHSLAWVEPSAHVIGDVNIETNASIWFGAVVRGDQSSIHIQEGANIQDNAVLHVDPTHTLVIGNYVSVGHGAVVHGATIQDHVLIGMNATILNGAIVEEDCIIAAGAVVKEKMHIPRGSLVAGNPAVVKKQLSEQQIQGIHENAQHYIELMKQYQEEATWNS